MTTEDARRLFENAPANDVRIANLIFAVGTLTVINKIMQEADSSLGLAPRTSFPTIINDLRTAVDKNPGDVTTEVLKAAQNVVSSESRLPSHSWTAHTDPHPEMQKAIGHTNAPHPELETELQEEIAKIEPKVVEGTVTIEEANHLHSLEARAHGHTERVGITSIAQSVAAKRERQASLGSGSSPPSNRSRANSKTVTPQKQSHRDKEANLQKAEDAIKPKVEEGTVTTEDADLLHSRETRAHGQTEKGGLTATTQSIASKKSDQTNLTPEQPNEMTQHERNVISEKLN
jgi:hypothetical protein